MQFGLALLTLLALRSDPVFPVPSADIAFERNGSIFGIHPDGAAEVSMQFPKDLSGQKLPTWSPHGEYLAFARVGRPAGQFQSDTEGRTGRVCEVYVQPMEQGELRRIARVGLPDTLQDWYVSELEWAKDGRRLMFALTFPYEGGDAMPKTVRYQVDYFGDWLRPLSENGLEDSFPLRRKVFDKVSPDGKWRLREVDSDSSGELFVLGWGDTIGRQVTHTARLRDTAITAMWTDGLISGAWSPDGAHILFEPTQDGADLPWGRLFSVNADGTNQMQLSQEEYLVGEFPTGWSPDGKRLVFEDNDSICVTDFTPPVRKIAEGHTPDWRPGGDRR